MQYVKQNVPFSTKIVDGESFGPITIKSNQMFARILSKIDYTFIHTW